MPGDAWQQFDNLRALFGLMWAHPGKKLLFMGCEFGQRREWAHESSLEWHVLAADPRHEGVQRWVADLNRLYTSEKSLFEKDFSMEGFRWIQRGDWEQSVVSFLRQADDAQPVAVVCNFTPVPRHNYRLGVPHGGRWRERLNSDAADYGGSGQGNLGVLDAAPVAAHGFAQSLELRLPPLAVLILTPAL